MELFPQHFIGSVASIPDIHQLKWRIFCSKGENQLHWTLDVAFGEDKSQKRAGGYAAQNFSLINKVALNVLKNEKSKKRRSMKVKRHRAGWDNDYICELLNTAKQL